MSDRDQFEAWWEKEWCGEAPMDGWGSLRESDGYICEDINAQWEAWQASREALKAERVDDSTVWYLVSWSADGGRFGSVEIGIPNKWRQGDAEKVRAKIKEINHISGKVIIISISEIEPSPPSTHPIDTTSQQYEALSKGESK